LYRDKSFVIRLTQKEMDKLNKNVKLTGKTREGFVRTLLMGFEPQPLPTPEHFEYVRALWNVVSELKDLVWTVRRIDECLSQKVKAQHEELARITKGLKFLHAPKESQERKAVI